MKTLASPKRSKSSTSNFFCNDPMPSLACPWFVAFHYFQATQTHYYGTTVQFITQIRTIYIIHKHIFISLLLFDLQLLKCGHPLICRSWQKCINQWRIPSNLIISDNIYNESPLLWMTTNLRCVGITKQWSQYFSHLLIILDAFEWQRNSRPLLVYLCTG